MSRSTIGGVVGAVIGFVVTGYSPSGAYWGWVVGSGVGALTDNTKTYGPRAGDAAQQASQDGAICTYGYGEFTTTGVILWRDERKEKEVSQGKGGPKNVSFEYTWSYAIGVSLKIGAYLIIERNGTRVYDARSDAELLAIGYTSQQIAETRAAQSKFLERAKLYLGDYDQPADPTIQAVKGVNNTPNYGGRAYIVLTDDPVTNDGAAIPQYRFVVAECGAQQEGGGGGGAEDSLLVTGQSTLPGDASFAAAQATTPLTFVGILPSTGADIQGATCGYFDGTWVAAGANEARISTDDRATWSSLPIDRIASGRMAPGPDGWLLSGGGPAGPYDQIAKADPIADGFSSYQFGTEHPPGTTLRAYPQGSETHMCRYAGGFYWMDSGAQGELVKTETLGGTLQVVYKYADNNGAACFHDIEVIDGVVYAACLWNRISPRSQLRRSFDGGATFPDVLIDVPTGGASPVQLKASPDGTLLAYCKGASYVWTSADDFAEPHATGIARDVDSNIYIIPYGRQIEFAGGKFYIISGGFIADPTLGDKCVTTTDGLSFSSPVPLAIRGAISIAATPYINPGYTGEEIPDAPGYYVDVVTGDVSGPTGSAIVTCDIRLADIVSDQCAMRSVTRIITTELNDDIVRGFRVAAQTSPKDNIRSLQGTYCFDASDHDAYLRFLKRPQPDTFFISKDDLVANENRPIEWDLTKENDLLRKVSISYFDPLTNYTTTQQVDERGSGTIKAQGEGVFDSALTADATFMKRVAHKSWKIAWAEKDMAKFTVRLNHAARYTGEWGKLEDGHGVIHVVRITHIQNDGVVRHITVRKTSRAAYSSNAVGVNSPLPTFPGSGLLGPTLGELWNLPVLNDSNDKPGLIWAPAGVTSGWAGAVLQVSRNGVWEQLGATTRHCNIGTLVNDLPASDTVVDDANVLRIRLGSGIYSLTFEQFLNEGNPIAVRYSDGTAEVLQCQFVTPVSEGVYDCTRLLRGRLDTVNGEHSAGASVVFLNTDLQFIQFRKDDVGKTISYRSVSSGTDPDAAIVQTITLTTMESQREWQPWNVTAMKDDGCQWLVDWIQRPRLGTDANPIQSQWWIGDRVDFVLDGITKSRMTRERPFLYTTAMQTEDFGGVHCGGYGITVVAVNEYTGGDGSGGTGTGSPGGGVPIPPSTAPDGSAGSTTLGPNGGYADNNPPPIPPPTTLGSNVITDPTNIDKWRDTLGGPLNPIYWNMVSGKLHYAGGGNTTARYHPALVRMPVQPISRYTITFSATITTALGKKAAIGVGLEAAVFAEYPTPTPVTVVYDVARTFLSVNGSGFVDFTSAPEFHVADADGVAGGEAWVSSPDFQIDAVPVPVTQEYPAHLDFDTGVADWVAWPPDPGGYFGFSASGGVVTFTSTVDSAIIRNVYCKTPLTLPDALGKYIGVGGEVCSNSTKTISGITWGGASFGIIIVKVATGDIVGTFGGPYQRGDFTEREFWFRQHVNSPGVYSIHAAILVRVEPGKFVKVKDMWTKTTDSVLTP